MKSYKDVSVFLLMILPFAHFPFYSYVLDLTKSVHDKRRRPSIVKILHIHIGIGSCVPCESGFDCVSDAPRKK